MFRLWVSDNRTPFQIVFGQQLVCCAEAIFQQSCNPALNMTISKLDSVASRVVDTAITEGSCRLHTSTWVLLGFRLT